ncbi:MAG: hypothetical protein H8E66_15370 [Planctomycetes bacterium]|nr:hypothetical protein [Planctomycetota bacterium]
MTTTRQPESNVSPKDYAGPESCRSCHAKNYEKWSTHPHRWMNAIANSDNVHGDFSGSAVIEYRGGKARFYESFGEPHMELWREETRLTYEVLETIGSRFFQYYVGRLTDGPFPDGHPYREVDHVLPFGYWLDRQEWVPIVHIGDELPDRLRVDPFALPQQPEIGVGFAPYSLMCNVCHTTFPLGDSLIRKPMVLGVQPPYPIHFDAASYTRDAHPELLGTSVTRSALSDLEIQAAGQAIALFSAPEHAASLGISCEACHLGCDEHVKNPQKKPRFLPQSQHLMFEYEGTADAGRNPRNVNWICSRCHTGVRPQLAAGMSTWNSTEYSDASRGSCYSQLTCVDCHDPHEAIGPKWQATATENDARCIRCHERYDSPEAIAQHTHHPVDSSGARCMNCHMPRLNEGLQNVVRTHMIFSPTEPRMIESNNPNACNICHTEQPIDWTLDHLKEWYGATFSDDRIQQHYPNRDESVCAEWLRSKNESIRLIATDAAARSENESLLPRLIDLLDDDYLLNRQFAMIALEKRLDCSLKDFGYRFYMTRSERLLPIEAIRAVVASGEHQQ